MVLFKNEEWLIQVMISTKGNLYCCIYYRGMHMGFVNLGDFKTQNMFYQLNCPELVDKAKEIRENYMKGDKK